MAARHARGARGVQGVGKMRGRRVGWLGWLRRAHGGLRARGRRTWRRSRPACPASKNKRKKVTSTPEVSGTRQKPGPDASGFSSAIDLRTRLHRSRVPASKRKGCPALLGKTSVPLRSTGLGQRFPTRARAEAWPVGDPSVIWRGAVQKRRTQLVHSSACSTNACGRKKAMHSPTAPGPIQSHLGNDGVGNFQCLFLAMPRGITTPGFAPHLPVGSPSWRAMGPGAAKCQRVKTTSLGVGCSGRVLERPLERPLAMDWAGAQAPIPEGAPPSPRARAQKH